MILSPNFSYYIAKNIVYILSIPTLLIIRLFYDNNYVYILSLSVCIILLMRLLIDYLIIKSTSWEFTQDELIYKRGVISTKIDYMELYRIYDYSSSQTIIERTLGLCSIEIESTDNSHPILKIYGIKNSVGVKLLEELRINIVNSKKNKNVYEIANK